MLDSVKRLLPSVLLAMLLAGCGSTDIGSDRTSARSDVPSHSMSPDVVDFFAGKTQSPAPTRSPSPTIATFGEGTKIVGVDLQPGTYKAPSATTACRWTRLSGFGGTASEIVGSGTATSYAGTATSSTVVTVISSDAGFVSSGCGTWTSDLSAVATTLPTPSPALTPSPNPSSIPEALSAGLKVVIVTSTFAQVIAHVTPGAICSASANVLGVPNVLSPSTQLATKLASDGLALIGWLLPSFPNHDAAYSNTVTCSFAGQTQTATQIAVMPTFASTPPPVTQGPLRTETFSGTLSGAAGVAYKTFTITLATPGTISASLDWSSSPPTDLTLNLSVYCAYCPPGADTTVRSVQTGKPKQLNYTAPSSATYFLSVYIQSGSANFTLKVTHP